MPLELGRRQFVAGAAAVGVGVAVDALAIEPNWLSSTTHDVVVRSLPAALNGYRIAQISDVHLKSMGGMHEELVRLVRGCELAVVTGDMIDNRGALNDVAELCSQLREACPRVVASLGNWEHWSQVPLETIRKLYERCEVELLVDDAKLFDGLVVAATDDGATGRADFGKTFAALPADGPRVLLTHAPGVLATTSPPRRPFDLVLCGHTHGGQVAPFGRAIATPPGSGDYVAGWYESALGRAYVSRGIGTSIAPVRFWCRPELATFTLLTR